MATTTDDLLTVLPATTWEPPLPDPRGPLTAHLLAHLRRLPHVLPAAPEAVDDPLYGDDSALALYLCYELHYRGLAGVDEGWEWEPSLLGVRRELEEAMLRRLVEDIGPPAPTADLQADLRRIATAPGGPSLSRYAAERASIGELREFAIHRSAYQLKEADPHTWAIPRLSGGAKAAMVEIQNDEYGGGVAAEMHATLFADTMAGLGLDTRYGAYLDHLPGTTLATVNVNSFFGLHRRWRGALVGHLTLMEMTSVTPMGRYAAALERLGQGAAARRFYDVHVVADVGHEHVAVDRMAAGLATQEPALAPDIVFGARALTRVEQRFSRHLLESWALGLPSLLRPVPGLDTVTLP